MPRLEGWSLMANGSLSGQVFGHPNIADGEWVITTKIKQLDLEAKEAVTKNTFYTLGAPRATGDVFAKHEVD